MQHVPSVRELLAISLLKGDQRDVHRSGVVFDAGDEIVADRLHQRRRCELVAAMIAKEPRDAAVILQLGLIDVEIHPIDAFEFHRDMLS